jgi:hypothetical protein
MTGRGRSSRNRARARQVRLLPVESSTPPRSSPHAPKREESEDAARQTAPSEDGPEETRWAVDDLTATWWDDVWPFNEGAAGERVAETRTERVEDPSDTAEEEVAPPRSEEPPSVVSGPPPSRVRISWVAALVIAVALADLVLWLRVSPTEDQVPPRHHADQHAAPVHLDADTSYVRSRVLPSGKIEVTHWIRTGRPVRAVTLQTPDVPGLALDHVLVSHVQVFSDGNALPVADTVFPDVPATLTLPPTRRVFIRYRLSGVTQKAGGSQDRALARITALDVSTERRLVRTTRTVVGVQVLSLACTSGRSAPIPCGDVRRGTWSTTLGTGRQHSQVMAQVNLS